MKLKIPGKGNSNTAILKKITFIEHLLYLETYTLCIYSFIFPKSFCRCVNQGIHLSVIYPKLVGDGTEIWVKIQNQTLNMWSALLQWLQKAPSAPYNGIRKEFQKQVMCKLFFLISISGRGIWHLGHLFLSRCGPSSFRVLCHKQGT